MSFNIVSGGVVRHLTYCTYPGQVSVNKRDWQCVSISGGSDISSTPVLTALDLMVGTDLISLMSEDAAYYGSQLYYQTPVGAAPRPDTTRAITAGGGTAAHVLPLQVSGLISLYSAVLGKSGQGRIYVPFPATTDHDLDGVPTGDYLTRLSAFGAHLIAPKTVISGGITAVFNPVLYIPGGVPPKQLIRHQVRAAWATQRRRGNFGRLNANPF